MHMKHFLFALIVFGLVLAADPLAAQEARAPAAVEPWPDAALPPELDRVLRDYERAWRAGDAKALAALFAEDGFILQAGRPPVRGRSAIQAAYASQGGSGPLRLRALAYETGERIGYIIGAYRYGDAPNDIGKFTLTLRRAAGAPWQIVSDMDNENAAPPSPANTHETAAPADSR